MRQYWIEMARAYIKRPAHFYSGCRKIVTGCSYDFPDLSGPLDLEDIGYTKSKLTMLTRHYRHEESIATAQRLWEKRLERGTYGSVSFTTYNHFIKSEKTSKRGSVMGPCIQSVVLTLVPDGTTIDVFYRTTELFKKFPADLVLLRDVLLPGFALPDLQLVRFAFANVTCHPMYFVTLVPYLEDPANYIDQIKDPHFRKWVIKWTARYLCPQFSNGIAKFSQGLRVQKHALEAIDDATQRELRKYLEPRFQQYARSSDDEEIPGSGDSDS